MVYWSPPFRDRIWGRYIGRSCPNAVRYENATRVISRLMSVSIANRYGPQFVNGFWMHIIVRGKLFWCIPIRACCSVTIAARPESNTMT